MDFDTQIEECAKQFKLFSEHIIEKNPKANIEKIKKAYDFCLKYHADAKRESGEPYYYHPIAVSLILLENYIAETEVICAALLHDVVEDTNVTLDTIKDSFGKDIADLVEGLTNIEKEKFANLNDYKSENLRKIILATAKDVRVMFVKLADRLHNMRTLSVRNPEKQMKIAKQTLSVYAPIAEKIGLYAIKSELEDLSFLYLDQEMYHYIAKKIELTKKEREQKTRDIVEYIQKITVEHKIDCKITGRAKHFFSIYNKMVKENKTLDTIYDLYGIRIIVGTKEECYTVKNILDNIWETEIDKITGLPRIKDYIQNPKPNGYQSIHINYRYEGRIIEVQIRTKEMEEIAESGVAKHWRYKANERDKKLDRRMDFLRELVSWKTNPSNKRANEEFKIDVFGGEIVCITPKGDPIILKEGATPLDFAFAIHTNVGNHFEKAEVNGKIALINHPLRSGDIVNILVSKNKTVSKQWLNYVFTSEAKHKLKQALTSEDSTDISRRQTKPKEMVDNFEEFQLANRIEVLGKKYPIKLSKCCFPSFGDDIVGYSTKDKRITIHKKGCPDRFALDQKSEVKVNWVTEKRPQLTLFILSEDLPGILKDVLDTCLKKNVEVLKISSEEVKRNFLISLVVKKNNLEKIHDAIEHIRQRKGIIEVKVEM